MILSESPQPSPKRLYPAGFPFVAHTISPTFPSIPRSQKYEHLQDPLSLKTRHPQCQRPLRFQIVLGLPGLEQLPEQNSVIGQDDTVSDAQKDYTCEENL